MSIPISSHFSTASELLFCICCPFRKLEILPERGGVTPGGFVAVVSCIRE